MPNPRKKIPNFVIFKTADAKVNVVCAKFALTTQHGTLDGKTQKIMEGVKDRNE